MYPERGKESRGALCKCAREKKGEREGKGRRERTEKEMEIERERERERERRYAGETWVQGWMLAAAFIDRS